MLKELSIRNFAIIDSMDLEFGPGFNVFTGETGAGKSIILDALSILLGEKADASFIREGAAKAVIEGTFDYGEHKAELTELLESEDLLPEDGIEEITLLREMRAGGRAVARVNGSSVSTSVLQAIGSLLVDIHGQSEHLSLLKPSSHIHMVDRFADNGTLLKGYRSLYKTYCEDLRTLEGLRMDEKEAERQKDLLAYQIDEIEEADLQPDEEEKLLGERERLANMERINKRYRQALRLLNGRADGAGLMDMLDGLDGLLGELAEMDAALKGPSETVINVRDMMQDVLKQVDHYRYSLQYEPHRAEEIETRLQLIGDLKRKYGGSVEAIRRYWETASDKLGTLMRRDDEISELSERTEKERAELSALACSLSANRRAAAERISAGVVRELAELRMPSARFEVAFSAEADPNGLTGPDGTALAFGETGFDRVEFLIAPNPGEGLKSLAKIASGGETSRLMLAMKNTLARADTIPTMVFDEIDQGIGGRIGSVVGEKLWQLSRCHQVLCITHLPQLAAMYDVHFHVRKEIVADRTHTIVTRMDAAESLHEMASLLGADNPENLNAVRVMLSDALAYKTQFMNKEVGL